MQSARKKSDPEDTLSTLVELVNALDKDKFDVTVMPIYRCDDEYIKKLDKNVKIKKVFNKYFRGLSKFIVTLSGSTNNFLYFSILLFEQHTTLSNLL